MNCNLTKAKWLPLLMDAIESSSDSNSSSSEEELDLLLQITVIHNTHSVFKQSKLHSKEHLYDPSEFLQQFRVHQNLVSSLVQRFRQSEYGLPNSKFQQELQGLSHQQQLLCFLFYIGHQYTESEVNTRFGVHLETFKKAISSVVCFLSSLTEHTIKWPTGIEQNSVQNGFQQKGFQGVLGCLDVIYIPIDCPKTGSENNFHSISLQGICDHTYRFTDIYIGAPGLMPPSLVLKTSPLYTRLPQLCRDGYILASGAYPTSMFILTPYPENNQMPEWKWQYNEKHGDTLAAIQHSFHMLRRRFPCLYHLRSINPVLDIKSTVEACCVLHNLAEPKDLLDLENDTDDDNNGSVTEQMAEGDDDEDQTAGRAFRKGIAMQMYKVP